LKNNPAAEVAGVPDFHIELVLCDGVLAII